MDKSQRDETEKLVKKELEKLFKKTMQEPGLPQPAQEFLQALWHSHAGQAGLYRAQGRLREAIEEYRKDTELEITSYATAAVVEIAFCDMGDTFTELGESEKAIAAYESALEIWRKYGYGAQPHGGLAKAYLESGRVDEAISICEEALGESRNEWIEGILAEAKRRKCTGEQ